jgi:hypothetical protein
MKQITLTQEIIDRIKSYGFKVYMRDPTDTWLHYTDGKNIGYLQYNRIDGFSISTVHIPNQTTGHGFKVDDGVSTLDKNDLEQAFRIPSWASNRDREVSKPWSSIEAFINSNDWNRGYKEV